MIKFDSKIANLVAVLFLVYLFYNAYQTKKAMIRHTATRDYQKVLNNGRSQTTSSQYILTVPENKKYEDYNILEKILYKVLIAK